ncbi:hypothetical protein DL96DRAFT_1011860 [Flagelloscypha sp. PMI_526]|nr:hypothetical protein DL96DRAFT_1011860 [Flagelloscypha sp. PMI_526]
MDLRKIFSFPPEIIDMILVQLEPLTLIALSRTTRASRNYLVGPRGSQNDHPWRVVRLRAGLPDLSARDITNRQYLLLVLDQHCHDCFAPNVTRINFINCARLCTSCHTLTFVGGTHSLDFQLTPGFRKVNTQQQRKRLLERLHPASEVCAKHTSDPGWRIPRGIDKISKKLFSLQSDELTAFIEERKELKKSIETDAKTIQDWMKSRPKSAVSQARAITKARQIEEKTRLAEARRQTIDQRQNDIKDKLLGMGWTDQTLLYFWSLPGVSEPVPLTEPEWIKIRHSIVRRLRQSLLKRRTDEARSAIPYSDMLKNDLRPDLFPPHGIFIHFECVEPIWDTRVSIDSPIELEDFRPFRPDVWAAALPAIKAAVTAYQDRIVALAEERLIAAYRARGMTVPTNPLDSPIPRWRYFPGCSRGFSHGRLVERRVQHIVARFPQIHALMRDIPTTNWSLRSQGGSLFENITMKPAGAKRYLGWNLDRLQWLWVDLDGSESVF